MVCHTHVIIWPFSSRLSSQEDSPIQDIQSNFTPASTITSDNLIGDLLDIGGQPSNYPATAITQNNADNILDFLADVSCANNVFYDFYFGNVNDALHVIFAIPDMFRWANQCKQLDRLLLIFQLDWIYYLLALQRTLFLLQVWVLSQICSCAYF